MLVETYRQLRHSIVAFIAPNTDEAVPPIIGTGFVVHESGLIATTDHVIEAITALPGSKGQGSPAGVLFLDQLRAPGWLHQLSPTIQTGIISAVHPFPSTTPHGFTLNVMTQGGASGSPVFNQETGDVLGVLYAGVNECIFDTGQSIHRHPTNYSWAVPSHFLVNSLNLIVQREEFQSAKLRCKPLKAVFEEGEAINPFTGERQRAPKIPW